MDYQEETFDYIQQSLRTICLKCKEHSEDRLRGEGGFFVVLFNDE